MPVVLGKDTETYERIALGDTERFSGLYILGKGGTGKSTLLIDLALQDIEQGNGLLFIDPHADAIDAILDRIPKKRKEDVILLDPTDKDYAFGINPLYCDNPQDRWEREQSFEQARNVFAKLETLFGKSDEKLGIFLIKYLHNILYPLIENPGSTLSDIEIMLTNKPFREHLLSNMKYNADAVRRFWQDQFDALSKQTQERQLESTFNRISLFQRQYIREIISQPKSTIDFAKIMKERKIVLLRMPMGGLNEESLSFIGMLVVSQLLKTVFLRADKPEQAREPFAIYCDEFHYFATPDFARLFTETRKFKIMPVVAHQHRGQFKPDDPNNGATLAASNKVHFNLMNYDAEEFAKEVYKKSPTKKEREREWVISPHPVDDLLKNSHTNPEIRRFVNQYLRPMQDRREDIKEEIEGRKLYRMGLQAEAATYQLEAQIERAKDRFPDYLAMESSLTRAKEPIARSFYETAILQELHSRRWDLKQTTRGFNYFLTAVMEGHMRPGSERFADFLVERVRDSPLTKDQGKMIDLYIQLLYGDLKTPRVIPFSFAQAHGLFPKATNTIVQQAEDKIWRDKKEIVKAQRELYYEDEPRRIEEYKNETWVFG